MTSNLAAPPEASEKSRLPTFLSHAGAVAKSVVKHVPTRGLLWGFIAFVLGWIWMGLSVAIFLATGGKLDGWYIPTLFIVPILGTALFTVHGLHRGAARAALEIEQRFGLVKWIVTRVMTFLEERVGGRVSNLPLAKFEFAVKGATQRYLGSDEMNEGRGVLGWVLRRAKRSIADRVEKYTLAEYRAEIRKSGEGGGVSLEKVSARVMSELSEKLADTVMSPLNTQLAIFMVAYAVIGIGWLPLVLKLILTVAKSVFG